MTEPSQTGQGSCQPLGEIDPPQVAARNLSTMVAVDFDSSDAPERCEWCPEWRFEWVDLKDGRTVLREWHLPDRRVVTEWEEADPDVLEPLS